MKVLTWPKIDGFVSSFIRGKINNNMNKYILYKITSNEPIEMRVLTWPKIDGMINSFIRGQNK